MSENIEIDDRNHEFGKKSDPVEQELAHAISHRVIAYLDYMRSHPGYASEIQVNIKRWQDPKYSNGASYTFSIVHKSPE
jgi:hypothetical protein